MKKYKDGGKKVDAFSKLSDEEAMYYYMNGIPLPKEPKKEEVKTNGYKQLPVVVPDFIPQTVPVPTPTKKKKISFEKLKDADDRVVAYSPVFENYNYNEARNSADTLPTEFNGIPVQFNANTYGEFWNNFYPGTTSDQWKFQLGGQPYKEVQPWTNNTMPYMNWNTQNQWVMPPVQTSTPKNYQIPDRTVDPLGHEYAMRKNVSNMLGTIGNMTQGFVDTADMVTQFVGNINNGKKEDRRAERAGLSDNLFYTGQGSDRGDYWNGMLKPNQNGNFSYNGMFNGMYYPQAKLGLEVSDNTNVPMNDLRDMLPALKSSTPVQFDTTPIDGDFAEYLGQKESSGRYDALPYKKDGTLASSAVGKYQFLWNTHKNDIQKVTGVKTKEEFRKNPQAQEQYYAYYEANTLIPVANKISELLHNQVPINQIKKKVHFAGPKGAMNYYMYGKETTDAFGTKTSTYKEGGEYIMDDSELNDFLKNGGTVEYL